MTIFSLLHEISLKCYLYYFSIAVFVFFLTLLAHIQVTVYNIIDSTDVGWEVSAMAKSMYCR